MHVPPTLTAVALAAFAPLSTSQIGAPASHESDGRVWLFDAAPGELDGLNQTGLEGDDVPRPILVDGGHDANGDGVPDLLLALPASSGVEVRSGQDGALLGAIQLFVREACFAGDTTGDGRSEILIGFGAAPGVGGGEGVLDQGVQLFALEGGDALHTLDEVDDAIAFCAVGDVNDDGRADYAVARADTPSGMRTVELRSGADASVIRSISKAGDDVDALGFGARVAGVGDVNGDLVPDLTVAAPFADFAVGGLVGGGEGGEFLEAGRVFVYSGASGAELLSVPGPAPAARFGLGLRAAGDMNGDSVPDLVVFSHARNPFEDLPGSLHAISGFDGGELFRVLSVLDTPSADAVGTSLTLGRVVDGCGAGDVNGDGRADVAAAVILGEGADDPALRVFSGADGSLLRGVDLFGTAGVALVSPGGDLNGDGFAEVAAVSDAPGAELARTQLVFGGDPWFGTLGDLVQHLTEPGAPDAFLFEAVKGTPIKAVVKRLKGSEVVPALDIVGPLPFTTSLIEGAPTTSGSGKSAKLPKGVVAPDTGTYRIAVSAARAGEGTGAGGYQLKTKGGKPKAKGVLDLDSAEAGEGEEDPEAVPGQKVLGTVTSGEVTTVLVPGVAGAELTLTVKRGKGSTLSPEVGLNLAGESDVIVIFPEGTATNPKTAKVKGFELPFTGLYRVIVQGDEDSEGAFVLRAKLKLPKGKSKSKLPKVVAAVGD